MIDFKQLRKQIKDALDKETTEQILNFIGYKINRDHKFKIREEQTASASVDKYGRITDFGDGWHGDPVALLHEKHGLTLPEATKYTADLLRIPYE